MVRGCWLRNADIVSCSLGHNWTVSLRDMDFCAPHSQHRAQDRKQTQIHLFIEVLCCAEEVFYSEALSLF